MQENIQCLDRLFPLGAAGTDVLDELAPEGWEASPLGLVFRPTREQRLDEAIRIRSNIAQLAGRDAAAVVPDALEQALQSYQESPCEPVRECGELVCKCLWDVFAEHQVISPEGDDIDLGSWRGTAGEIADWLGSGYDYMDFYMGTQMVARRADIRPVYSLIFTRMRKHGFDWKYEFPRLGVVSFREPDDEFLRLKAELDTAHEIARNEARDGPVPAIVEAYTSVFGRAPTGWPP